MRKFLSGLAALVLGFSLVLSGMSPAEAAVTYHGCPGNMTVCFYNYQSFNEAGGIYVGGRTPGVCYVLPTAGVAGWTNGKVYNASSSILLNWSGNSVQHNVFFYDSNACSGSDYYFFEPVNPGIINTNMWRLNPWAGVNWNDRVGSFMIS